MPRLFLKFIALTTLIFPVLSPSEQSAKLSAGSEIVLENEYARISKMYFLPESTSLTVTPDFPEIVLFLIGPVGGGEKQRGPDYFEFSSVHFANAKQTAKIPTPGGCDSVLKILIDLKSAPPFSLFEKDAVKLDTAHNKVLFENDRVRVVHVHFGLGEKGPVVDKRPRVIILLNDMHADVARHEGDTPSPRDGKAGVIQWSLGGSQATMNRSETELDNVVVEIKGK